MSSVYVPVLQGVYAHDLLGVFTTPQAAEEHARAVISASDQYHDVLVFEVRLDEPTWPTREVLDRWEGLPTTPRRAAEVRLIPWKPQERPV